VSYVIYHTKSKTIEVDDGKVYKLDSTNERHRMASAMQKRLKEMPDEKRKESVEKLVQLSGVNIPPDLGKELVMSWNEIKEMSQNGVSFGAHTVNHPILTKLPLEEAEREILMSKQHIENKLDQAVTTFCYPNGEPGDYNSDIEKILRNNGFKCAVTVAPSAFVSPKVPRYRMPRIPESSSLDIFYLLMSGLYLDLVTVRRYFVR
jgi:hypothetical protein